MHSHATAGVGRLNAFMDFAILNRPFYHAVPLAAWCLSRDTFFMERSADNSIILYWQHDGPNSRRKPPPMTADELMTTAQAATLKRLAQAAYELDAFKPNLTRTEADIRIAMLTAKLKLLDGPPHTL